MVSMKWPRLNLLQVPLQVKYLVMIKERYKTRIIEVEIHRSECSSSVTCHSTARLAFRLRFARRINSFSGFFKNWTRKHNPKWDPEKRLDRQVHSVYYFPQGKCQSESPLKQSVINIISAVMWPKIHETCRCDTRWFHIPFPIWYTPILCYNHIILLLKTTQSVIFNLKNYTYLLTCS